MKRRKKKKREERRKSKGEETTDSFQHLRKEYYWKDIQIKRLFQHSMIDVKTYL